jgi:L-lactate dehydrogenase complex protein LldF
MLLDLRRDLAQMGRQERLWQAGLKLWRYGMTSPGRYTLAARAASLATRLLKPKNLPGPLSGWTKYRAFPHFGQKTFRQLWQERKDNHE